MTCSACGSAKWFACRPGTAPNARVYPSKPLVDADTPAEPQPMVVFCFICWWGAHRMVAA
jgi:hypothetical protein